MEDKKVPIHTLTEDEWKKLKKFVFDQYMVSSKIYQSLINIHFVLRGLAKGELAEDRKNLSIMLDEVYAEVQKISADVDDIWNFKK
jgi:hypothetical protein